MDSEETNIDLTLAIKEFDKQKEDAKKFFNESYSGEEPNEHYRWEDLWLDYGEESVDGNTLKISGNLKDKDDNELGWIDLKVPLHFDKLIDIFQGYIKKLNKVKTVMESVRDE